MAAAATAAAATEAAAVELVTLQAEFSRKEKILTSVQRDLKETQEELSNRCRENDDLRRRDEGLFYPHMPTMAQKMPGHLHQTVGQYLNENPEVNLLK